MTIALATATLATSNQFCDWVAIKGVANFSLNGTLSATVFLQKSYNGGTTIYNIASYTADTNVTITEPESGVVWRAGIPAGGGYASSSVVRISQ